MSKRFGRNQKRAMRKQIAIAEAMARQNLEISDGLRREVKYQRAELDEAKDMAAALSVVFPAKTMEVGEKRGFVPIAEDGHLPWRNEPIGPCRSARFHKLHVLLANIHADVMKSTLHVAVEFGERTWGYALTNEAIRATPEPVLCRRIAEQLARIIAAELKQVRR